MRIKKLTAATIKRIIAEEKQKLSETARKDKLSNKNLLEAYVKYLKLLKKKKAKTEKDLKRINEAKKILKYKLLKRI